MCIYLYKCFRSSAAKLAGIFQLTGLAEVPRSDGAQPAACPDRQGLPGPPRATLTAISGAAGAP